jgi:hypothetical protein
MGTWSLNPINWLDRVQSGSGSCALVGALNLFALLVVLVLMRVDHRELMGINVWIKPAKFLISTTIYLWSIGWLLNYVESPIVMRSSLGTIVSLLMLLENASILMQAARGVRSHYNTSTAFDGAVFGVMGVAITVNTLCLACLLWWFVVQPAPMPAGALWGCRLGVAMAVLASIQGYLIIGNMAATVGVPPGGPGLPFLNWSTQGGDLRISHFIGLHGLQVLPLAGFWLSEVGASAAVFLVALGHYGLFALTYLQAMAKKPLFF